MVVVPFVLSSIVLGIAASGDTDFLKRIGFRIAPYFVSTTAMSVLIGATIALWIAPGQYLGDSIVEAASKGPTLGIPVLEASVMSAKTLPEQIIEIIPTNPTSAIVFRSMFQIVILVIFIEVALSSIAPSRAKPILDLCVSLQDVSMKVVSWTMALAPAAVFGLLAQVCVQVGFDAIKGVGAYMRTVLLGLILLLGFYLLIVLTLARRNPFLFLKSIWGVQLLAFSTSSSAAVMPLSMKSAEETLGI
jgi:proton glutamate symport protein